MRYPVKQWRCQAVTNAVWPVITVVVIAWPGHAPLHSWCLLTSLLRACQWKAASLLSTDFALGPCCSTEDSVLHTEGCGACVCMSFFSKCKLKWGEKNITLLQVLTFLKIASFKSIKVYSKQIVLLWRQVYLNEINMSPRTLIWTMSCDHLTYQTFYWSC